MDENQAYKELRSLKKSVKVQFMSPNITFNCSHGEGTFLFNSAKKQFYLTSLKFLKRNIFLTPHAEIASCLLQGLLFKQWLAIGQTL